MQPNEFFKKTQRPEANIAKCYDFPYTGSRKMRTGYLILLTLLTVCFKYFTLKENLHRRVNIQCATPDKMAKMIF